MNIVYLPLDSRPCNYRWPREFLSWAGHHCIRPNLYELDHFKTPSCFETLRRFLLENMPNADALVVSVDQLCYGSLLASRTPDVSMETALVRLRLLSEIKRQFPDKPIHAVSVIMRASISALCKGDLHAYRIMSLYSEYSGKQFEYERQGKGAISEKFRKSALRCREALGTEFVRTYHAIRQRNHKINSLCASYAAEGILDSLLLLQEDASKYGFHRQEQDEINRLVSASCAENIFLHNGADEGGMMAAMRAVKARDITLDISYSYGSGNFYALYEDRPFRENVADSLRYLGIAADKKSKVSLVIHAPYRNVQREAESQGRHPDECECTLKIIKAKLQQGKQVYLLDVAYANGGSLRLIGALKEEGLLPYGISGYSAWNTATNSLGTLLSQTVADAEAQQSCVPFKWERVLDDGLYQSDIRFRAQGRLADTGEDVLNLRNKEFALHTVKELFQQKLESESWPVRIEGCSGSKKEMQCCVDLPWERLFETDISMI